MTNGPLIKKILLFALPIVIGNILQQLYSTVDTIVVGNYCDKQSLAAMGTSTQPVEILLCIFLGVGSGISILTSQYIGRNSYEELNKLVSTGISFIYIVGIPLSAIGYLVTPFIMHAMGVPEDAFRQATDYTGIIFLGTLGQLGYNMNAGILRGLGDSRATLNFLLVSCVINIVLDIVFVPILGLGVIGAAISTVIAQYISWFVSIQFIIRKYPEMDFSIFPRSLDKSELKKILSIGIPIGLNSSLFAFGHTMLQVFVNDAGSVFMAGVSVGNRVTSIANVAINGFSSAGSTFSGQNYGAGNYDRLREGYLKIPIMAGIVTIITGIIFVSLRMPILRMFSQDEETLFYASRYIIIVLAGQWCFAVFTCITNILNGVGQIKYTTIANLCMLWVVRIPCAYIINHFFDKTFVMLCYPISFFVGMCFTLGYYFLSPSWKEIINRENSLSNRFS